MWLLKWHVLEVYINLLTSGEYVLFHRFEAFSTSEDGDGNVGQAD